MRLLTELQFCPTSSEKRPFSNGLFSIQSEGLVCNHRAKSGAWNPSLCDGMASRVSVYPPSDGFHTAGKLRIPYTPSA